MAESSPSKLLDFKFTVFVQKTCHAGPYIDPRKVQSLPDFFQENSVHQTVKKAIEAIVSTGFRAKEVFDKVPQNTVKGFSVGPEIKVVGEEKDGKRKQYYCRLPILDRISKGEIVIDKFIENLKCCSGFLSYRNIICNKCNGKLDSNKSKLEALKQEPEIEAFKKDPVPSHLETPKGQFTLYCRRNCRTGSLLDPTKVKKLATSFNGSFPKVVKELVPAIILCGYNPIEVIKRVPSSQGGCILIEMKIGKLNRMCLVGNVDCYSKFWSFTRRFCSALGMCENFFSDKPPKKSCCKRCRNEEDDDFSAVDDDDDDFQEPKHVDEKRMETKKRKSTCNVHTRSYTMIAKKSRKSRDIHQAQCKELKVVIKKLSQETVDHYLQKTLPTKPSKKQAKQEFLAQTNVNVITSELNSPEKILFPGASNIFSSLSEGKDDDAENLLNIKQDDIGMEPNETAAPTISMENDADDSLLETFLDKGVQDEDASPELTSLKEISENITKAMNERNPLRGLFENSEEKRDGEDDGDGKQEEESFKEYSDVVDVSQLYSPNSFFGDVLSFGQLDSNSNEVKMKSVESKLMESDEDEVPSGSKRNSADITPIKMEEEYPTTTADEIQNETSSDSAVEVDTNSNREGKKEDKASESKGSLKENNAVTPEVSTDFTRNTVSRILDFSTPDRLEAQQQGSSTVDERSNLSDSSTQTSVAQNIPLFPTNENQQVTLTVTTHDLSALQNSSSTAEPLFSSCDPAPKTTPSVTKSHPLDPPLQGLEVKFKDPSHVNSVTNPLHDIASRDPPMFYNTNISVQRFSGAVTTSCMPRLAGPVNNFEISSLTSSFGLSSNLTHLDNLSGSCTPSMQVPSPSVSAGSTNSGFPALRVTNNTPFPGTLPGTFSTSSNVPVQVHGINVLSHRSPSASLIGNVSSTSSVTGQHSSSNIHPTMTPSAPRFPSNPSNRNTHGSHLNVRQFPNEQQQQHYLQAAQDLFARPINVVTPQPYQAIPFSLENLSAPKQTGIHEFQKAVIQQSNQILIQKTSLGSNSPSAVGNQQITGMNQLYHAQGTGNNALPHFSMPRPQWQPFVSSQMSTGTNFVSPPLQGLSQMNNLVTKQQAQIPTTKYYPSFMTGHLMSQPLPLNIHQAQLTSTKYHPTFTNEPMSSQTPGQVQTTRYQSPSQDLSLSKAQAEASKILSLTARANTISPLMLAKAPVVRFFSSTMTDLPNSQSFPVNNQQPVGVVPMRCYPPSTTGQSMSQPPVMINRKAAEAPNIMHPTTSIQAANQPVSVTNPSPRENLHQTQLITPQQMSQTVEAPIRSCPPSTTPSASSNISTGTSMSKNPLASAIFIFLKRCCNCPESQQMAIKKKVEEMLRIHRLKLAVTQRDISDLEELVGRELKNDSSFQDMLKLLTQGPVMRDAKNQNQHEPKVTEQAESTLMTSQDIDVTQSQETPSVMRTAEVTHVTHSPEVISVTESVISSQEERTSEGYTGVLGSSASTEDKDVVVINQASNKESVPTSNSDSSSAVFSCTAGTRKFNKLLPRPVVRVSKIQDMTVLLWDLPNSDSDEQVIKEYELYAIQVEAKEQLTREMIRKMTWKKVGVVKALPPPMAITLTNLVPGLKSYMIVRGIGTNGDCGPFSQLSEEVKPS